MKVQAALDNSDPKQRFAAIKHIARTKNVTMLKKLTQMARDDPDEQVRSAAAKAIDYIKADSMGDAVAKPQEVVVSAKDVDRAKRYIDSAIGYQINGERERALKELSKALEINPRLKHDPFYKSVVDEVTGESGEEALRVVSNPDQLQEVADHERKRKLEKRQQQHQESVDRSRWSSVIMDLAIYTFLSIVLAILGMGLTGQSAQNYLTSQEAAIQAFEDGERDELPEVDPAFYEYASQLMSLTIPVSVIAGLITGITSLISLLVNLLFTHIAARFVFGGRATLPHLIYKVVSYYNTRLPILYGIIFVTIVLMFAVGGGIIPFVGAAAIGLFSLMLFFQTIARIGQAYDFGTGKGCLSFLVGSIIVAVISFVVQLMFFGSVAAMIASQMEGLA